MILTHLMKNASDMLAKELDISILPEPLNIMYEYNKNTKNYSFSTFEGYELEYLYNDS